VSFAASIRTRVGIQRTPNLSCKPSSGAPMTKSWEVALTAFSLPARSCESFSTAGATIRQGPHHGAQKSIRTGIGLFSTTELNSEVLLSVSHGSGSPHFGQCGTPSRRGLNAGFLTAVGAADDLRFAHVFCLSGPRLGRL